MTAALAVSEASDPRVWDEALLRAPGADLLQSWQWGDFKALSTGWKPMRVLALRAGEPAAGAQILARRILGTPSLYAPRGPWWHDEDALQALVHWLRRRFVFRAPFLRADPLAADAAALFRLGFAPAPRQIQPRATIIVDLRPPEDEIIARFDRQVRYNARLAARKGIEVTQGGPECIAPFWRLLMQTAARKGFAERELGYFVHLRAVFGDAAPVFLARRDGELLYAALIVAFGKTAYYLYGASGGDRSAKPSELVQLHAMRWAKRWGAIRYDMWGIPAHPTEDNPLYGVYRFKRGFGGSEVHYAGALDLPLVPIGGHVPAQVEVLALKSLAFARGRGFRLDDHLD